MTTTPIAVAYGDGIGPEIMRASLRILEAAGADIEVRPIEVGKQVYERGVSSGIEPRAWDTIAETKIIYKAPISTPQGGGYKSMNVTIRKTLDLYANVRPSVSYFPAIETRHPLMDLVIVRENEEDLYAGIEHRQTPEVYQTLKLVSRPGSEKIIRYAFEFARNNGRKRVTCMAKDNIMKMTDGIFHTVFDEIAQEYPEIDTEFWIIDIGTAKLAATPEEFDVIVLPNLYGDILSDVAAQLTGSVGLGTSSNIGHEYAMFEAVHGSAPDIAGRGIANPSGLLLAAIPMLVHIGQPDVAGAVHNAWLRTIEDRIHTGDIYTEARSKRRVGTEEFADAVIERLGQKPRELRAMDYTGLSLTRPPAVNRKVTTEKQLVGVDVFLDWDNDPRDPNIIGQLLEEKTNTDVLKLKMITNRGQKVYPEGMGFAFCTDHWRCRYTSAGSATHDDLIALLQRVREAGLDFIKTENLYTFDGEAGYSKGQGE